MRHFVHDSKAQVDSDGQLAVTSPRNGEMQHRKSVLNFLTKRRIFLFEKKVGGGTQGTSGKMLMNFDGGKKKRAKWACHCLMRRTRRTSPVKQSGPVEEVRMPSRHQQPGWWQPKRESATQRGELVSSCKRLVDIINSRPPCDCATVSGRVSATGSPERGRAT